MKPTKSRLAVVVLCAAAAWLLSSTPVRADTTVTVAAGENLFRIALRHGTTVSALVRANGLSSPDRIFAGQRLVVPGGGAPRTVGGGGAPAGASHLVRQGENLYRIAQRYGTTVSAIVRANGLASPDRVFAGQRLTIPSGRLPAAPVGGAPSPSRGGRQLVIDLSDQRLLAMDGGSVIRSMAVSSGVSWTPTPVGSYRIYARYASQRMSGPGYNIPAVPWVQYFHQGYALHGTYWHSSFGTPMSHGCVNLSPSDAQWLWSWSGIGTPVVVRH